METVNATAGTRFHLDAVAARFQTHIGAKNLPASTLAELVQESAETFGHQPADARLMGRRAWAIVKLDRMQNRFTEWSDGRGYHSYPPDDTFADLVDRILSRHDELVG